MGVISKGGIRGGGGGGGKKRPGRACQHCDNILHTNCKYIFNTHQEQKRLHYP